MEKTDCKHENWTHVVTEDEQLRYLCNDCGRVFRQKCEVWSRPVGYLRPTDSWNVGKKQEFKERVPFDIDGT